jgi:integrase
MPIYRTKDNKGRTRFRYEFDRLVEGRRQRVTKLLPLAWNRSQAEEYGRKQDGALYRVATGSKPRALISDAVVIYLKNKQHLKSIIIIERELANCLEAYEGRYMDELGEVSNEYQDAMRGKLAPATIKNRLAYIRAACRFAWKKHKMGDKNPADGMSMPFVKNEKQVYMTRLEVLRVARKLRNPWVRAVFLVAFYSGMRLGECMRADTTEIRGRLHWLLPDTKNDDTRAIPVHHRVMYLARQWPPQCGYSTVQHAVKKITRQLGLSELVSFHTTRHSTASAMINADVDLYTVGAVLGHKSHASTQRYAHLATKTLDAAVRKI